jgi:hypothetical protein
MLLTASKLRRAGQGARRAACEGSNDPAALVAIDEAEFCILLVRWRRCRPCSSVTALINSPNSEKGSLPSVLFSPLHLQQSASKRIHAKPMHRINYEGEFNSKLKGPILSPGNVYLLGTSSSSRGSAGCRTVGHWG